MTSVAYETTGRVRQKARTRAALVDATRRLLGEGQDPTVEDAAAAAGVARTTAYRYFPNQAALLRAAFPEIDRTSLLGADPPTDVEERVLATVEAQLRIIREWEPQLRAAWRVSLAPGADAPVLRGGRAVAWFQDALAPLPASPAARRRLAVRLRAAAGIEAYTWLIDVAGLKPRAALDVLRANARAVLADGLAATGRR
jgi:AcrR family transcriptional regulator